MAITKTQVLTGGNLNSRKGRYPKHPFALRARPTQLVPFLIAPVLPGETMTGLNVQARLVTDPVVDRLTGWWAEMWCFYVKLTDIDPDLSHQFLPGESITRGDYQVTADDAPWFVAASATYPQHNWLELAVNRVVEEYFHLPGQSSSLDDYPQRRMIQTDWTESMIASSDVTDPTPDTGEISDVVEQMRAFLAMTQDQMSDMTWDQYLRMYGVRAVRLDRGIPEPVFQSRNWTYPTNTIDPSDGSAATAVSWVLEGGTKKRVAFREPGFVIGLMCYTPKVQRSGLEGTLTGELWGPEYWMSPLHVPDTYAQIKELADGHDLVSGLTGPLRYDLGDLFMYGEAFRNYTPGPLIALPADGDLQGQFMPSAGIDALFVDAGGGNKYAYADGIASLNIMSSLRDET